MAKKFEISINNLPKDVIGWKISILNQPKKVIKAYLSVGNYAKVFWDGGGGGSIIGFWFYYSTIIEKIIDGKRYTVVPTQIPVEVRKKNRGIAFYFFIQQIEDGNIIENLVFTVSTDSTATPFNGIWGGQTYPFDSVNSTTVNNDTWYYTIGAPFGYDYAPQYPADISPNCIVKDADLEELYDVEDMVKGFLNRYVYTGDFAEDYQVGQTYNLVGADIEKTVRKAIAIFLFKNAPLIANRNSYQLVLSNVETIVNHVLNDKGNYDKIHIVLTIPNDTDIWCAVYYSNDAVNNATLSSAGYGYETAYELFEFYNPTIQYYKYTQIRFLSNGSVTHQSASYTGVMTRTVGVAVTENVQAYHGGHQVRLTNLGLKWG